MAAAALSESQTDRASAAALKSAAAALPRPPSSPRRKQRPSRGSSTRQQQQQQRQRQSQIDLLTGGPGDSGEEGDHVGDFTPQRPMPLSSSRYEVFC